MIGRHWTQYKLGKYESKFTLIAAFNVMQYFLFQSTVENANNRVESLKYLQDIYNK